MIDKLLTTYKRHDGLKPDFAEKLGNGCLYFLRTAAGKSYQVTDDFHHSESPSITARITCIALAILTCPLILIGAVSTFLSKTHGEKPRDGKVDDVGTKIINSPNSSKLTDAEIEKIGLGTNPRVYGINSIDKLKELLKTHGPSFTSLNIDAFDLTADFDEVISAVPNIQDLSLNGCTLPNNITKLNQLNNIVRIDLVKCGVNDEMLNQFEPIFEKLTKLDLSGNLLTDNCVDTLLRSKGILESLNLESNKITNVGFIALTCAAKVIKDIDFDDNLLTPDCILPNRGHLHRYRRITFKNDKISAELLAKTLLTREDIVQELHRGKNPRSLGIYSLAELETRINVNTLTELYVPSNTSGFDLIDFLNKAKNLTKLRLDNYNFAAGLIDTIVDKNQIELLEIINSPLSKSNFDTIANSKGSRSITTLSLGNTGMSDESFTTLVNSKNLSNLQHLYATHNTITDLGVASLIKEERASLTRVYLDNNKLAEQGVASLLNNLDKLPNLEQLSLKKNPVSPFCLKGVKTFITKAKIELEITRRTTLPGPRYCTITYKEMPKMADIIEEAAITKKLYLTTLPTDEEIIKICELDLEHLTLESVAISYENLTKLVRKGKFTQLTITGVKAGDKGYDILTQYPEVARLTHLTIDRGELTDGQFKKIIDSPNLTGLKELCVPGNLLNEASIDLLHAKERKNLIKIDLDNNKFTPDGVIKLINGMTQFPNLKKLWVYGTLISREKLKDIKAPAHTSIEEVDLTLDNSIPELPQYIKLKKD